MATYQKLTTAVPSSQRSLLITAVAAGDQIDIEEAMGRPARKLRFFLTDAADILEVKVNSLLRLTKPNETGADETVKVWSAGVHGADYSYTGAATAETMDGLRISSIEIVSLTLSAGTTIEIVAI